MPSVHKTSNKNYRVEANRRAVEATMAGEVELAIYAKITSKLGEGRMKIYFEEGKRGYEGIGKIRGVLRRKGQVPIQTNDIVIVTPREFESSKDAKKHFDIIGVITSKQASDLKKRGEIPDYFLADATADMAKKQADAFDFDYNADADVDIDAI
jgi:initiation factor 1A